MKNNKRLTIGFAGIADFRSIIGQDIVAGINNAAKDFNINLINFIGVVRYSLAEDIEYYTHYKKKLKYLNKNNIDGLISWASSFQYFMSKEEIEDFHQSLNPLPLVTIGLPLKNIPLVLVDNHSGINELMTHLINVHGYSKFAFIGCKGHFYYEERYEAYKEVLKENNIPFNQDLTYIINEIDNRQQVKQCLDVFFKKRKLSLKKDIEVFITVSDLISQKLTEELLNMNVNVPNDVAVVGFNNQLDSIRSFPPLTTVDPHFFQLGYQAIVILLSIINGKKSTKKILIPCQLIIRQSCGCFEELIAKAEIKEQLINTNNKSFDLLIKEHYDSIVNSLTDIIVKWDNKFNNNHAIELIDSFTSDIISGATYRFLHAIKKYFFDYKNVTEEKLIIWQNVISEIRNLLLPFYIGNNNILPRVENIFHQTRVMIDVAYSYLNFSKKGDVYKTGALVRIAADFSTVEDIKKITNLIKIHLNELEIPGIYLAIHDEPKGDIGKSYLMLAYSKDGEIELKDDGNFIPNYQIVPSDILPNNKRFSMIFELIYYKDLYLGFALFEMGPLNIPIYDTLRTILSPSLYRAIIINKKMETGKEKKLLIQDLNIKNINLKELNLSSLDKESKSDQLTINAHKILEYLLNHINEPTDLLKVAQDLNLSVPSLIRKTKQLTGYSIQKLHEILKIEKAKLLLENKILNISEIADRLGYQNQFYFSQVFKKHTGMSPKKWVELYRK